MYDNDYTHKDIGVSMGKPIDLIGATFGRLTVIKKSPNKYRYWVCRCSCGRTKEIFAGNLTSGKTKSCGCLNSEYSSRRRLYDMTGQVFGRLTVLRRADKNDNQGRPKWLCRCICGKTTEVAGWNLRNNITQSCGCLQRELNIGHLKWETEEEKILSQIYESMKERCYAYRAKRYRDYGGRGIRVCAGWLADKGLFIKWAKESGFRIGLSIDRIDNDGPYAPWNCQWATPIEQANNRRSNKYVIVDGVSHTIAEWARLLNMKYVHFWKLSNEEKKRKIKSLL